MTGWSSCSEQVAQIDYGVWNVYLIYLNLWGPNVDSINASSCNCRWFINNISPGNLRCRNYSYVLKNERRGSQLRIISAVGNGLLHQTGTNTPAQSDYSYHCGVLTSLLLFSLQYEIRISVFSEFSSSCCFGVCFSTSLLGLSSELLCGMM